jgi:hypothetical protein
VREQPAAVAHQHAQQVELDRREVHRLAVTAHGAIGEIDLETVGGDHRLAAGGRGAAQGGPQARDELARAERLTPAARSAAAGR